MQQNHRRMGSLAGRHIDERIDERAMAGDLKTLHGGGTGSLLCFESGQPAEDKERGNGNPLRKRPIFVQSHLLELSIFCNYRVLSYRNRVAGPPALPERMVKGGETGFLY